jgi:toxin-antitoxin system PIN domain toxin
MISIDTNLLLYSLNPDSSSHQSAASFLAKTFDEEQVVISDLVLVELYLLLRNPFVLKKPLSSTAAAKLVRSYFDYPSVVRAENAPIMDKAWSLAAKPNFARRRIIDIRLALTLQHHGVTRFATANTKDFQNLGFEKVWNPLT